MIWMMNDQVMKNIEESTALEALIDPTRIGTITHRINHLQIRSPAASSLVFPRASGVRGISWRRMFGTWGSARCFVSVVERQDRKKASTGVPAGERCPSEASICLAFLTDRPACVSGSWRCLLSFLSWVFLLTTTALAQQYVGDTFLCPPFSADSSRVSQVTHPNVFLQADHVNRRLHHGSTQISVSL